MRALFLNPTGRIGGAETALLELMAGLRERNPERRFGLIAASDGPLVARARALGAEVRVLPFPSGVARLGEWGARAGRRSRLRLLGRCAAAAWPAGRYLRQLRAAVREMSPEILHTNGLKMHVLAAWARPPRRPLVWHVHDYVSRRPLSARLLRRFAPYCAAIVTPSQSVADDVRTLGASMPPVDAIWNAIDLNRYAPTGAQLDLDARSALPPAPANTIRVGLVATLAPWKGHLLFLDAVARLPPGSNIRAYVIGGAVYDADGSQLSPEALRAAASRLGVTGRVGFTGFLEDPAPAIRALDVVVHASTEPEPFGLAIAEGMACGRAVVVSPVGGAAQLVTPETDALTFTPGDAGSLAAVMTRVAADVDLRRRLGHHARATAVRRFDRRRLAGEINAVYEQLAPSAALRVLHVHSGNLYGGVETFLTTLARNAEVTPAMTSSFALCFDQRLSHELRAHGHSPHMLGPVRLSRPHTIWNARRALARLLDQRHVDVVVCHLAWAHVVFAPTIRQAGLPLVFWLHAAGDDRHWLERWTRAHPPDLAIANSRFTSRNLATWFADVPIETVYCPLKFEVCPESDGKSRRELRRSLQTTMDDVVIVQVGRLEPLKGNHRALAALARLRDVHAWKYWIVGGPQRPADEVYWRELHDIVDSQRLTDRVRFLGQRDDVARCLRAADIYCQPNTKPESFGLALVEAQAAGLPIVTSALGGAVEIVDDASGRLVAPDDIDALALALRQLVTDAGLRGRLGHAARARASLHCDLGRQMQRMHDVLSRVVQSAS